MSDDYNRNRPLEAEILQLRAEIERLRMGFMRFVQDNNDCPITGVFCRPGCGCELEMKEWIQWTGLKALEGK